MHILKRINLLVLVFWGFLEKENIEKHRKHRLKGGRETLAVIINFFPFAHLYSHANKPSVASKSYRQWRRLLTN